MLPLAGDLIVCRSQAKFGWILGVVLLGGCAAQTVYFGPNAATMASPATIATAESGSFSLTPDLFHVLQIDGQRVPESQVTGTFGVTLALDDTDHRVVISAAHVTPLQQVVGVGEIPFRPVAGVQYVPYGKLEGDSWILWISEKATGQPASSAVKVKGRIVAPTKGPDIGPMIPIIAGH